MAGRPVPQPVPADGLRGLQLDAGAFLAGPEKAARVEAEVTGKPSPAFFGELPGLLGLRKGSAQ